jgi:hypothetical protein
MASVKSIVDVLRETDLEIRKDLYMDLMKHRVEKKRFGRPHGTQRGGPRWGKNYDDLKEQGFQYEIEQASKFGLTAKDFVEALRDRGLVKVVPKRFLEDIAQL